MHMRICQRLVTTATHFESVLDIQTETSTGTCAQETRLELYVYKHSSMCNHSVASHKTTVRHKITVAAWTERRGKLAKNIVLFGHSKLLGIY